MTLLSKDHFHSREDAAKGLLFHLRGQLAHPLVTCGRPAFRLVEPPRVVPGRRVAVVRFNAGMRNDALSTALKPALVAQVVPWELPSGVMPAVYLDRRQVVIEVPLDSDLQDTNVRVSDYGNPGPHAFVVGPSVTGVTITLNLLEIAHALIAGCTGSGKSWLERSLVWQLSRGHSCLLVLLDGKYGQGLGPVEGLPGQVGPLARERDDIAGALCWVIQEMKLRHDRMYTERRGEEFDAASDDPPHLVVLFDEFQEYMDDPLIRAAVTTIARQGRSARVHLFLGTQKPTNDAFGDASVIRDQLSARVGLMMQSSAASQAAMGGSEPNLTNLIGAGDAYVKALVDGTVIVERVQAASVPPEELRAIQRVPPMLASWPRADALGLEGAERDYRGWSPPQAAASVYGASLERRLGRVTLQRLLDRIGDSVAGNQRADDLRDFGREVWDLVQEFQRDSALPAALYKDDGDES